MMTFFVVRCRMWLCVLAGSLLASGAAFAAASFASGADVVMISGIAGDVESESEYEEINQNLAAWLQAIDPAPASVTIFSEHPPKINLPNAVFQEAKKETIDAFIQQKNASKNASIWLVWGHGGLQKGEPILHVKGPRVAPSDLLKALNSWPSANSNWVLSFPGSGFFAYPLSKSGASVLSSERDVIFKSDPVLMLELSRQLREKPELTFDELAKTSAERVFGVYKNKTTARTEEPIFWQNGESQVLLAEADAKANANPEKEKETVEPVPTPEATPARPPATAMDREIDAKSSSAELWRKIEPVDPAKFPEEKAVLLSRKVRYVIGNNPVLQTEIEQFVQILTKEGQDTGDIQLSYDPPGENLEVLDCEIRRKDGRILRIDTNRAGDSPAFEVPGYNAAHTKTFSIPGVEPGAIIRVHTKRSWKQFPLPHIYFDVDLGLSMPSLHTEVEVRAGKATSFHYMLQGIAEQQPEIESTPAGKIYKWQFDNIPAVAQEILAPPDFHPRLLASTFPDWPAFATWYERLIKLADVPNDAIKEKAAELTQGLNTDKEKVEAVYNYVTALRYVMIPLGVNSHRPHSAESTFANQFGDCKDKANLFNTMLRTLGLEAYLVLVPRFTQANEKLPGFAFNHAISQVRLGDEILWIDTTDPTCPFGMLPPGDPGRKVLVIDGKSRDLQLLPNPDPALHSLKLTSKIDLSKPDGVSTIRLDAKGFADYMLRVSAAAWNAKSAFPVIFETLHPANGTFVLDKQKLGPIADLSLPAWWEAEGSWAGLESMLDPKGKTRLLRAPVMLPEEWAFVGNRRTSGLQINKGYPVRLTESFEFQLPAGAKIRGMNPRSADSDIFSWSLEWKSIPGGVKLDFNADLRQGDLSVEQAAKLSKELAALREALASGPVFEVP